MSAGEGRDLGCVPGGDEPGQFGAGGAGDDLRGRGEGGNNGDDLPVQAASGRPSTTSFRELGGAIGVGVLGNLTLSHYRSALTSVPSGQPAAVIAQAQTGLAQALTNLGLPTALEASLLVGSTASTWP
jgi:hypothetical protein